MLELLQLFLFGDGGQVAFWPMLIGAGLGAAGGLLGGGGEMQPYSQLSPEQQASMNQWLDLLQQGYGGAMQDFTGARGRAVQGFEDIYGAPGFTEEERAGMMIGPEEEAGILRAAVDPITGAANTARDNLLRASAARGNYGPGLNASIQRVQQEQGRQAGASARDARLGIAGLRRESTRDIGLARMGQQQFGASGRAGIADMDQNRLLGFGQLGSGLASRPTQGMAQGQAPWWQRMLGGAAGGLAANLPTTFGTNTSSSTSRSSVRLPNSGYTLGQGGGTYRPNLLAWR